MYLIVPWSARRRGSRRLVAVVVVRRNDVTVPSRRMRQPGLGLHGWRDWGIDECERALARAA